MTGWAGLMDVTPDAVPVISAVDAIPGFYIARAAASRRG
jgi:glycine/D-amino acid oxidase-like deaminating enzyme